MVIGVRRSTGLGGSLGTAAMAHYLSNMRSRSSGLRLVLPISAFLNEAGGACVVIVHASPVRCGPSPHPSARPYRLRSRPIRSLMHLYKNKNKTYINAETEICGKGNNEINFCFSFS